MSDINNTDRLADALQELVAESMLFGMQTFRDGRPHGSLFDEENRLTLVRFELLNEKTKAVIQQIDNKGIHEADVLPLYEEIFRQIDQQETLQ